MVVARDITICWVRKVAPALISTRMIVTMRVLVRSPPSRSTVVCALSCNDAASGAPNSFAFAASQVWLLVNV